MKEKIEKTPDARQTQEWGDYLKAIGWNTVKLGKTVIFIRKIPFLQRSIIKIQHPFCEFSFREIDNIAQKYHAFFTIIEPHIYGYSESYFLKNGYSRSSAHYAPSATIKIDLQKKEDDLFKTFSENARRNIKKSQKNNITIKAIYLRNRPLNPWFDEFYALLKNLAQMKRFYIPSYDEFYKKMKAFKKTSVLLFAYEKKHKSPIAVVWYACFEDVIAYFQTGITKRGYELLANYLLVWEGMKMAQKLGLRVFDFEFIFDKRYPRVNKKHRNYTEFKKKFHGEEIYYPPTWIKFHNKAVQRIYQLGTIFNML